MLYDTFNGLSWSRSGYALKYGNFFIFKRVQDNLRKWGPVGILKSKI